MNCKNQRFGHNFLQRTLEGYKCTECGIGQWELNAPVKKFVVPVKEKIGATITSPLHLLVNDIRKDLGETATKGVGSFGFYIGFFKRVGEQNVRVAWSEVKEHSGMSKRKLFWWKMGQMSRKKIST